MKTTAEEQAQMTPEKQLKERLEAIFEQERRMGGLDSFDGYLAHSIVAIDALFGEGYARNHPELLGHCVQAQAHMLNCYGNLQDALEALADQRGLEDGLKSIAEALNKLANAGFAAISK